MALSAHTKASSMEALVRNVSPVLESEGDDVLTPGPTASSDAPATEQSFAERIHHKAPFGDTKWAKKVHNKVWGLLG